MERELRNSPLSSKRRDYFARIKSGLKFILMACIRGYRAFISPLFPPSCRFYPTCSEYTLEAVEKHGPGKGLWLGMKRILRCHPRNPGGYDPVP